MAAPSRRERSKAQNRETILAAAARVFAEMGFARATVRDVIRATPLASGTFYNYFKSKEEVYQALRDDVALAVRPSLREARQSADTAQDFLFHGFRAFFVFIAARRPETPTADVSRFRMDSPEVLAGFAELRQDLDAAIASGLLPTVNADFLTAALTGLAFELGDRVKQGADVDAAARFATQLVLGGLGAVMPYDAVP